MEDNFQSKVQSQLAQAIEKIDSDVRSKLADHLERLGRYDIIQRLNVGARFLRITMVGEDFQEPAVGLNMPQYGVKRSFYIDGETEEYDNGKLVMVANIKMTGTGFDINYEFYK